MFKLANFKQNFYYYFCGIVCAACDKIFRAVDNRKVFDISIFRLDLLK